MLSKYKYHILLHVIIFMWGFTGILGKLIHLDAYYLVWHRVLIALVALGIALAFMRKSVKLPNFSSFLKIAGVGLFVVLHWMTFYKSIQLSTASLGILCLSTATLHVTWLEPIIMKRKFSWIEFLLGTLVIYGIYFGSWIFKYRFDFSENIYTRIISDDTKRFCVAIIPWNHVYFLCFSGYN